MSDFWTVTKYFSETNIKYHTYQLPEERNLSVIIRNLPISISEEEIFTTLDNLKYNVTSVTRLQNRHKSPIPIVAVILDKSAKNIFSLDRLLHCVISVENRKNENSIPQCRNCQRFNHTKHFCKLPPRCVKCLEQHHYSKCTKNKNSPPTCVNCNENHPSNYKGCKIYKQIKKYRTTKAHGNPPQHLKNLPKPQKNEASQPALNTQFINSVNQTYAKKVKQSVPHSQNDTRSEEPTNNTNVINELVRSLMPLFTSLISEIIKKVIKNIPSLLNNLNVN